MPQIDPWGLDRMPSQEEIRDRMAALGYVNEKRRTGRTTRIIEAAVAHARAGGHAIFVANNCTSATRIYDRYVYAAAPEAERKKLDLFTFPGGGRLRMASQHERDIGRGTNAKIFPDHVVIGEM